MRASYGTVEEYLSRGRISSIDNVYTALIIACESGAYDNIIMPVAIEISHCQGIANTVSAFMPVNDHIDIRLQVSVSTG